MDLSKKLQIKPKTRLKLVGAPKDLMARMGDLPSGAKLVTSGKAPFDGALVFCANARDVTDRAVPAASTIIEDGLLWLCYPKGTSGLKTDISRDKGWAPISAMGLSPVRAVSIDETWSALRWRPARNVKKR